MEKCESASKNKCRIISAYKNQCVAVADPVRTGHAISSIESGPSIEKISSRAIANCQKNNEGSECKIGYTNCTEPIFQKF